PSCASSWCKPPSHVLRQINTASRRPLVRYASGNGPPSPFGDSVMDPTTPRKPFYKSLYLQVVIAIIVGVILGYVAPATGEAMKPLGDGFIKLIKMMIAPIIFCTVVVGIAGMEDMKKVGKTGGLALLYFEVV